MKYVPYDAPYTPVDIAKRVAGWEERDDRMI